MLGPLLVQSPFSPKSAESRVGNYARLLELVSATDTMEFTLEQAVAAGERGQFHNLHKGLVETACINEVWNGHDELRCWTVKRVRDSVDGAHATGRIVGKFVEKPADQEPFPQVPDAVDLEVVEFAVKPRDRALRNIRLSKDYSENRVQNLLQRLPILDVLLADMQPVAPVEVYFTSKADAMGVLATSEGDWLVSIEAKKAGCAAAMSQLQGQVRAIIDSHKGNALGVIPVLARGAGKSGSDVYNLTRLAPVRFAQEWDGHLSALRKGIQAHVTW